MTVPTPRIIVDGDSEKTYREGEKVTGRVILVVEEKQEVDSLKVLFVGNCVTKTTRPFHVIGAQDTLTKQEFEERIQLFSREKGLLPSSTLAPRKYSWPFEFTFPELTEPRYKRTTHGAHYLKEPHPLPPTFQLKTSVPGSVARISYYVQVKLMLSGSRGEKRCRQILPYYPTLQSDVSREAKCTSTVLYGQMWKPSREKKPKSRTAVKKVLSKFLQHPAAGSPPQIVPTILYPGSVAPGQHIPISLNLRNTKDASNEGAEGCTIDSISISLTTYSTSMCGHSITQPEDVVSNQVTCIARTDMNKLLPFGVTKPLTSNFRLINDIECVPTFKTYTITRRYTLGICIGLKFGDQSFTVRSTTPLEIRPRGPRLVRALRYDEDEDMEALPVYVPREPSKEFAPDYEAIFALSRTPSSLNSLAPSYSRTSSYLSDMSRTSTAATTPVSEMGEPVLG
jgi:hypothetical protein